ncbi:MAG: hypothetical protein ABFC34_16055 [Methanobacterium sp.]
MLITPWRSAKNQSHTKKKETGQKRRKIILPSKIHAKTDIYYNLIRELETTHAKVHDSQVDLKKRAK